MAATLMIIMMLFAALPVTPAGAVSLNITSVASGTWEATAWPSTLRSGTISVTAGNMNVTGTGTAFLTELSVGNILKTTGNIQIGTVASIASNTSLILANVPATTRTNIAYNVQGVGPADNAIIANTHNVTIAARPINQTGTVTVNAGGTLTVSNSGAVFSTLVVNGTVNGTAGNAFGTLTVNNGGVVNAGTNGSYTASSLTISSGGAVNILRSFTVNGATSITGDISFSSTSVTARAMVFTGPVTLNNGATWNEATVGKGTNNIYNFQDNLTNNASTFTASGTSLHTFSGSGKTISGSTTTSIARVVITGTYTNNGLLTVGTNLSGAGALTNSGTGTLNVGGTVSVATLANAGTFTKTGAGPITIPLANFTNTGTVNLNGTGTIAGITNNAAGIVNLTTSGAIKAFDNATASSVLNILALNPVPHFHTLTISAAGNTVNYGGDGAQTVKPITYNNLVFSGTGTKSITMPSGSTLANGNLSIAPTGSAKAGITGLNLSVNHLTLGGVGKAPGTWGSTTSAAANQDNNFFTATTGYLNVTNDARLSQTINFTSAAPDDATVGGPTYTPTAVATSNLPVTFSIDPTSSSVCSITGGQVSFLANGTCVIDADQAGDGAYLAATQQQSFDVKTGQTINFTSTAPVGAVAGEGTYTPTATATSGLTVEFTIDATASSVCSISAGVVSFDAAGTCVINADQAGDTTYHPAPRVQQSFDIGGPVYWLPWYNNVDLDTQLRIGNISASTATVHVFIGGTEVTPGSGISLPTGGSTRVSYAGVNNGPVKVISNVQLVVAERVIYKVNGVNTSFSEMKALSETEIGTTYWLPWYNNVDLDTQLRFANVSGSTATVHILIGGQEMLGSPFTLAPGESTRKSFAINNGPVKIESDQNIVAAERLIYKVNGVPVSFSEMMALPDNQLDTTYYLPWYNNVDLDTQLRLGNVSGSTATVHIFIGATEVTPVSGITLLDGESKRLSYARVNSGPVRIVSDVQVVAAERVIYTVNGTATSFSEMMGLPANKLDTTYWLPWYNNVDLDTQLRLGNVSGSTATVHIFIGGTEVTPVSGITLLTGASTRVSYAGVNRGPVEIVSDVPIVIAERVIYKVNGTPTSFSEMK
jgi:hypothetical protein